MPDPVIASTVSTRPISASLQRHLDEVLATIPSTKTGTVRAGVSLQGVEVSAAVRWRGLTGSAYASQDWGGAWTAGLETAWTF